MSGPKHTSQRWDDARVDTLMGRLLQIGVLLASAVVLVGAVIYLFQHGHGRTSYGTFHSEPATLRQPGALLRSIAHADPEAIIQLGLLLLIATPVARVAFAVVAFTIQRDKLYIAVSLLVLAVLLFGLIRGV